MNVDHLAALAYRDALSALVVACQQGGPTPAQLLEARKHLPAGTPGTLVVEKKAG